MADKRPLPENTAENILARMVANFPGLILDGKEVPGAELTEWITSEVFIDALKFPKSISRTRKLVRLKDLLEDWAVNGSPENDDENEAGYGR